MTPVFKAIGVFKAAHAAWVGSFSDFNKIEKTQGIASPEANAHREQIGDALCAAHNAALHALAETPSRDPAEYAAKMSVILERDSDMGSIPEKTSRALCADVKQCAEMKPRPHLPDMAGLSIIDLCCLIAGNAGACKELPKDRYEAIEFTVELFRALEGELFSREPANAEEALHQIMMLGDALPNLYPAQGAAVVAHATKHLKCDYPHSAGEAA